MIWYIALGSAIGGMLRYLLGGWIQRAAGHGFPLGTLVINVSGSLALGLLLRWASHPPTLNPDLRAFLTVGLCGAPVKGTARLLSVTVAAALAMVNVPLAEPV